MSSVWLTIPSARPARECEPVLKLWKERGYKIALYRDCGAEEIELADFTIVGMVYPGYAAAVNSLIAHILLDEVLAGGESAEWFIAAGDDTEPDPNKSAEEIAAECVDHFSGPGFTPSRLTSMVRNTFGVMQPTGDRWHEGVGGFENAPIDRVCGSAWYGREYCRRMYQGTGPLFPGYRHMFVDEEAQEVALKMGVLWQRRDLVQKHRHWGRGETDKAVIELKPGTIPPHLEQWNTAEHWREAKALFTSRKAAGFPGHEPIQ